MKPPEDVRRILLCDWVRRAEDDVQAAEMLMTHGSGLPNPIVFHAQQAVEKYLKAYLTWHQVHFPKTHDIERLLVLIEAIDNDLATKLSETTVLTLYGVDVRYPGDMPEATIEEAREAVGLMHETRKAVRALLPLQAE